MWMGATYRGCEDRYRGWSIEEIVFLVRDIIMIRY